jgi:hypothetical protein
MLFQRRYSVVRPIQSAVPFPFYLSGDLISNRRAGILSRRFVGKGLPTYNYLNSDFSNTL